MTGTTLGSAVEHLIRILSQYERGDLDHYSQAQINSTINLLDDFLFENSTNVDLTAINGLVATIAARMYTARAYATPTTPRHPDHYSSFYDIRRVIQQIRFIGQLPNN